MSAGVSPFSITPNEIRIIAVRHGEGERNHRGTHIQGWVDDLNSHLNETGLAQAQTVAEAIATQYPETVAVYTSDLYRCLQTTRAIAGHFFYSHRSPDFSQKRELTIIETPNLREINHGFYDTMSVKKRNEFCKDYYEKLDKDPIRRTELLEQFQIKYPQYPEAKRFIKWSYNPMQEIPLHEADREFSYAQNPTQMSDPETIMQLYVRSLHVVQEIAEAHESGQTVVVVSHSGLITTLATEAEFRQQGDLETPLSVYYEPKMPGSKIASKNCSCQVFFL